MSPCTTCPVLLALYLHVNRGGRRVQTHALGNYCPDAHPVITSERFAVAIQPGLVPRPKACAGVVLEPTATDPVSRAAVADAANTDNDEAVRRCDAPAGSPLALYYLRCHTEGIK